MIAQVGRKGLLDHSLHASVFVVSCGSVVKPARVLDGNLVTLLWLVNAVTALNELFL